MNTSVQYRFLFSFILCSSLFDYHEFNYKKILITLRLLWPIFSQGWMYSHFHLCFNFKSKSPGHWSFSLLLVLGTIIFLCSEINWFDLFEFMLGCQNNLAWVQNSAGCIKNNGVAQLISVFRVFSGSAASLTHSHHQRAAPRNPWDKFPFLDRHWNTFLCDKNVMRPLNQSSGLKAEACQQ